MLMILSTLHLFVKDEHYNGILKAYYAKEFHKITVHMELYKVISKDKKILDILFKNSMDDPTNPYFLNMISVEMQYQRTLSYEDSETILDGLKWIDNKKGVDWNTFYSVNFFGEVKLPLHARQIRRLSEFFKSYYSNYYTIDAMTRYFVQMLGDARGSEIISTVASSTTEIADIPLPERPPIAFPTVSAPVDEMLDAVFQFAVTPLIRSALIHYILHYYLYVDPSQCKIGTGLDKDRPDTICVMTPNVFPVSSYFDKNFVQNLVLSTRHLHEEHIGHMIRKILTLYSETTPENDRLSGKPVYMMSLNFLLVLYFGRHLSETYPDFFMFKTMDLIGNVGGRQEKILAHHIKTMFPQFNDILSIKILDIDSVSGEKNSESIPTEIVDRHSYLIPISENDFLRSVVADLEHVDVSKNIDINLNKKKIIDITNILENSKQTARKKLESESLANRLCRPAPSELIDPGKTISPIDEDQFSLSVLLSYREIKNGKGAKVISIPYHHMLEYVVTPKNLWTVDEIPKEVKGLYSVLSSKILRKEIFKKDDIQTISYYKILSTNIPNVEQFRNSVLLYIVFQIVIPYYYDVYGVTQFVDVLL